MRKRKFSINDLLNNNKIILLLSFLSAVALWITVSPNRVKTISVPVNVVANNNHPLGLEVVEGQGQYVNVDISGKWYVLSKINENDFTTSVDLSAVTKADVYHLPVIVKKSFSGSDFSIEKVYPDKITVSFDNIYTRTYSIEAIAPSIKAKEGYIVETPVPEYSTINIEGPQKIIESINKVVAEVEEEATLENSQTYLVKLKIFDNNGNEIDTSKLMLPFNQVNVTIPINISKTVPVKAKFINQPEDISAIKYTLSDNSINLIGSKEVLSGIDEIILDPIDFTEIDPLNNFFDIELKLPTGVSTIDDINYITVIIDTSNHDSKNIEVNNFKAINNKGLDVSVITNKKSVSVVGPKKVIKELNNNDVYLEFNLDKINKNAGEVLVPAVLKSNKHKNIWGYGSYQIQIKVK